MPTIRPLPIRRRGAAMVLILISLTIATIVATAYLASRDNSALIGQTVAASTTARWSANAGLDLTGAVLGGDFDLKMLNGGTNLVTDLPISGGGTLNVSLMDLERGHAVSGNSHWLHITSTVQVDGVPQSALAIAELDPLLPTAQLDLADFAIFAANSINLASDATVAAWESSRLSALGRRLNLGTASTNIGAVQISGDAAAIDATLVHTGAGVLSVTSTATPTVETVQLSNIIPMAAPPSPESFGPYPTNPPAEVSLTGQTRSISGSLQTVKLKVNGSTVNVADGLTIVVNEDMTMTNSVINFAGSARLIILGDLSMLNSQMLTEPGSRLDIFVGGGAGLRGSYIGEATPDMTDTSGRLPYQSVAQRFIWSTHDPNDDPLDAASTLWRISQESVIVAQIYAPDRILAIGQSSAIYGRIASATTNIGGGSALFYDPALDRQLGYASQDGPMYAAPGEIRAAVQSLPSLSPAALAAFSEDHALVINAGGRRLNNADFDAADPMALMMPNRPRVRMRALGQGVLPGAMETYMVASLSGSLTYSTEESLRSMPRVDTDPLVEDERSRDYDADLLSTEDPADDGRDDDDNNDDDDQDPDGLITSVLKTLRLK